MLIVKILASCAEFFAGIALALSLFRIPLDYKKIFFVAALISLISTYFRSTPELMSFNSLSILVSQTILLVLLFSLPIFYSILVTIIGSLLAGNVEYAVIYTSVELLRLTSVEVIQSNAIVNSCILLIATALIGAVTYFIQKRKIGFMFMSGRFSVRQAVKAYNFSLSAILVVLLASYQLVTISYQHFKVHGVILIALAIIFLIAIYISYKQNKRLLIERYERYTK